MNDFRADMPDAFRQRAEIIHLGVAGVKGAAHGRIGNDLKKTAHFGVVHGQAASMGSLN